MEVVLEKETTSAPCAHLAAEKLFSFTSTKECSWQITHWEDGLVVDANDWNTSDSNKHVSFHKPDIPGENTGLKTPLQ